MYTIRRQQKTSLMRRIKRALFAAVAASLIMFSPATYLFAQSVSAVSSDCSPAAATSGTDAPTGAWAPTFTYNSCTGLYENKYYTWSPATHSATYIYPMTYTCDTSTWQWTAQQYEYNTAHNDYEPMTITATQLPAGAQITASSLTSCSPPPAPVLPTTTTGSGSSDGVSVPNSTTQQATTATTGPDSANTAGTTATNNLGANIANSVALNNNIGSVALSGSTQVSGNTTGGSATSGNVSALANVLNDIQSTTSLVGAATFVANVDGNVQGNLLIDPSQIQPASNSSALTNNIDVNVKNSGQINNTINLNAMSGAADVTQNTHGGNATSGNATAIADVMNMINSMIGANQSFVGVVNINGNLQGNILVPQSFLDSLIASNAPSSTVTVPTSTLNNLTANTTTTSTITNKVSSDAQSGQAAVADNTASGSATTGDANTNVTVFNLTGSNVVGKNALLVFVNVLGKWVGVIMNAPAGATAAALGGGISAATTNNVTANAATNNQIANDITVAAKSGAATVVDNTNGGNAQSGNADTAVNLLNISNSNYSLSNWFGILFINVFGSWYGNFGALTPVSQQQATTPPNIPATLSNAGASPKPHVFQFSAPAGTTSAVLASNMATGTSIGSDNLPLSPSQLQLVAVQEASILGAVTAHRPAQLASSAQTIKPNNHGAEIIGGSLILVGVSLMIGERIVSLRRSRAL